MFAIYLGDEHPDLGPYLDLYLGPLQDSMTWDDIQAADQEFVALQQPVLGC